MFNGRVHLRHIFEVGLMIGKQGEAFYNALAEKVLDPAAKALSRNLARLERRHVQLIEAILSGWKSLSLNKESMDFYGQELKRRGIFKDPPLADATEEDIAEYAIHQEREMVDFYRAFENAFSDSWRRMYIQQLVTEERGCMRDLVAAYPQVSM
ncbi:MAG: ferritin family protein [Candidatus Omnitrophica bacterium]|nr:ferritin family protein [Candidatus Omnitrophota bacterium]